MESKIQLWQQLARSLGVSPVIALGSGQESCKAKMDEREGSDTRWMIRSETSTCPLKDPTRQKQIQDRREPWTKPMNEAKDEAKNQHSSQLSRKIQSAGRGLPAKNSVAIVKRLILRHVHYG